jgi:hypothetical protein
MTISELYKQLSNKDFQDHQTGNLFYRAYMYMYKVENEYEIENDILDIKNKLHRPNNYLDVMVIDIFEVFLEYLKQEKFGNKFNKFEYYHNFEIKKDAYDKRFLGFLNQKIVNHLQNSGDYEVAYVLMKGFSRSFPYIRASRFMNNFEKYINEGNYKLIMFYPGEAKNYYSLFGMLKDENLYRAIKLINE